MINRINLFITPSIDHKCYVHYEHPNVRVIDWTSIYSRFFYWSKRNGKHHWLPTEAIRFLQFACIDEQLDLNLHENTTRIVLNADGKNISYFIPTVGQYEITDYDGHTISGDASILYNMEQAPSEYHLYTYFHRTSTIKRTDYTDGPKILLIGDSMAIPWLLCLAPICSTLTHIDNRDHRDLSKFHLIDYDKCFAVMVNHPKVPTPQTKFVLETITYFANQITT